MSGRIDELIRTKRKGDEDYLMCALVAGDPHVERTVDYLGTVADAGADLLELIVPFSDPAYHGPVIQRACDRALSEDIGWEDVESIVDGFRETHADVPLVVSSYYNRILACGLQRFGSLLDDVEIDAVMVADLPWEEAGRLREVLRGPEIPLVPTVAPTTSAERIEMMARESTGFFVWTGHSGGEVTLSRREFADSMSTFRRATDRPVVASMKISTGEEAAVVVEEADGVLVGSALVWLIEGRDADLDDRIASLVGDLREHLAG